MPHLAPNAIIIKEMREPEMCFHFLNMQFKSKAMNFKIIWI